MITAKFLAEFERRALNGARAYQIAREHPGTDASVWFRLLMSYDYVPGQHPRF